MEHPEYIYWIAVCLIAWPAALFSRSAGILAGAWAIGQVAYVAGLPEPEAQVVLYSIAMVAGLVGARFKGCKIIAVLYLPLAVFSALSIVMTFAMWWAIFWTALLQVAIVPFTVDWAEVSEVRRAFKERRDWHGTLYRTLIWR